MVRWRILGKGFLQMGQMILGGTIAARTVGPGGTVDGEAASDFCLLRSVVTSR